MTVTGVTPLGRGDISHSRLAGVPTITRAMHLSLILDMAADTLGDRRAVTAPDGTITYAELRERADALAGSLAGERAVQLGLNSLAVPVTLFAAARAGAAFTPLNYRLADPDLVRIASRAAPAAAVIDHDMVSRVESVDGLSIIETEQVPAVEATDFVPDFDTDNVAIMLFTSGTTGEPKAAVLRHRHVTSYVMGTLEFASAGEEEATLVTVPGYHIAGISAIVSSTYVGRRIVYLPQFEPQAWVRAAAAEAITHAMVVPTMMGRILDIMEADRVELPALRHLSYGGGKMPVAGDRAGAGADATRQLRQRVRPHRDELDDRRAHARRPSRRTGVRRPGGPPPPRLRRAAVAVDRALDPRPVRRAGRRR